MPEEERSEEELMKSAVGVEPTQETAPKNSGVVTLHLIDGERGGVGKTFVTRTMAHYCLSRGKQVILVDSDRTNGDVANVYKDSQRVFFTDNIDKEDEPDSILEMAMESGWPAIVNLPAQVYEQVTGWIDRTILPIVELNSAQAESEVEVNIYKWFVCNGETDSIKLFKQSIQHFGGAVQHVLVLNWGMRSDWTAVGEDTQLQAYINPSAPEEKPTDAQGRAIKTVPVLNFPRLSIKERNLLNAKELTFAAALLSKEENGLKPPLPIWSRQRVQSFVKKAASELDAIGLL